MDAPGTPTLRTSRWSGRRSGHQSERLSGRLSERLSGAVVLTFDGQRIPAYPGECVAAALLAAGVRALRTGPDGAPRGAFCMMGICQECVVRIGGRTVEACRVPVRDGLVVERAG